MMNQLKIYDNVIYDSNLVIYYCFKTKETRIVELTDKTHTLTEFLINNGSCICVPKFLINEINRVDFAKMVEIFISQNQLTNMAKDAGHFVKMKLESKIKHKLHRLQQKDWFVIEDHVPSKESLNDVKDFFENLDAHPQINEFLNLKKRDMVLPSFEDMALITFSKERLYPIITNDYDITFFKKELMENNISYRIFKLTELDLYN